ncbi:hypothetical protein DL93DRAFT_2163159 [Clavulina sp. PMI_390]|nr:hypothetical protein DL93DRAFT_2163159 [Clavulina sp. PMI_390]
MIVGEPSKDLYLGTWLVAEIVATVLFGILTCLVYWSRFKRDKWGFKALVLIVWVLDFGMIAFAALWTYRTVLGHFAKDDVRSLRRSQLGIGLACMDISINGLILQLFYARRGYLLNRSIWATSLFAVVLATVSFISGMVFSVQVMIIPDQGGLITYAWLKDFWYISEAATDLVVALAVIFSLRKSSSPYPHETKQGLQKLMAYTLSNGMLTSFVAVATVVLSFAVPCSWIQSGLSFILARLYSNSLLNLRGRWVKARKDSEPSIGLSTVHHVGTNIPRLSGQSGHQTPPTALFSVITLGDPDGFQPAVSVDGGLKDVLNLTPRASRLLGKRPISDITRNESPELLL